MLFSRNFLDERNALRCNLRAYSEGFANNPAPPLLKVFAISSGDCAMRDR